MKPNTAMSPILKRLCKQVQAGFVESQRLLFRRQGLTEATVPSPSEDIVLESELSKRAFALWQRAGYPEGREWDFWDRAETDFAAESRSPCQKANFQTLRTRHP